MKTVVVEDAYNSLVGSQICKAVTCLVEDMEKEIKDEDVKEVNFYELWDVEFEMSLKDIDVWYAKEVWYGVVEFIAGVINSTILDEDKVYTWTDFIAQEKF